MRFHLLTPPPPLFHCRVRLRRVRCALSSCLRPRPSCAALRYRILQRHLQLLDRGLRKNHVVILQQVIGMHFVAPAPVRARQCCARSTPGCDSRASPLRPSEPSYPLQEFSALRNSLASVSSRRTNSRRSASRRQTSPPVPSAARPAASSSGRRSRKSAAADHARYSHAATGRPDRSDAGAAGALLLPQFLARTGNFPAALGFVRSGVLPGAVMLHRFPEQIFVDRAEDLVGQIERPDLFAAQIVYVYRCHIFSCF